MICNFDLNFPLPSTLLDRLRLDIAFDTIELLVLTQTPVMTPSGPDC